MSPTSPVISPLEHRHLVVMFGATVLILFAVFAVLFVVGLVKSQSFRVWFGGALSAFIDGFLEGCPIGSPAGAGIAAADGQVHADFDVKHVVIELAHVLAVPFFTGLADVRSYKKSNAFPNVFAPASGPQPIMPAVVAARAVAETAAPFPADPGK